MRKGGPQREWGGESPRVPSILFLCKKEGQGTRLLHILLLQGSHKMHIPPPQQYIYTEIRSNTKHLCYLLKKRVLLSIADHVDISLW
jgi:hypothetical protein